MALPSHHALYRFFSSAEVLLYVGSTSDLTRRVKDHAEHQDWWPEVATATVEFFQARNALEAAEEAAIERESPRFNKARKTQRPNAKESIGSAGSRSVRLSEEEIFAVQAVGERDGLSWMEAARRALEFSAEQMPEGWHAGKIR